MMFKIYDGRERFYQWDINQRLIVESDVVKEVHFSNTISSRALVCEVYEEDGARLVDVPNILLQSDWNIRAYGSCGSYVTVEKVFEVVARSKPDDYVYTETEVKRWDDIVARIDQIESNGVSDEKIESAVTEYLKDNPVNMEGYATEKYVDDKIAGIEISGGADLSNYYTKTQTDAAIEAAVKDIEIPEVDLTGYAKVSDIPDVSGYALKSEIPSTSGLATETYVQQQIAAVEIPDVSGYQTEEQVIALIAEYGGGTLPASEEGEF